MISPVIIAQIDEEKPSVPMQALLPQPRAPHTEPSLPTQGSAIVSRTFLVLPSRLEIQASLEDTMSPSDSPGPKQCPGQQRGFASITVTARRVPVGSGELAGGPGAGQEPSTVSPTPSTVPALLERWPPPAHAIQPPSKAPKSCSRLGEEPQKQLFDPGIKEDGVGLQSSDGREKIAPSFISCVQLQVCEPCPNTIYYLDRSLSVCIDQPRVKCQKLYRSTLSLSLKCSLSGLTADGVDGIANGEPMEETAPRKLPGAHGAPLRSHLSTDLTGNKVIKEEKTKEGHLGRKYPLQRTPMLLGSRKRSSTTTPGSLPFAASRETIAAAPDGSSNRADPSKDPSKPKEIQAQGVLKPKMSVSNSTCNVKASSGILIFPTLTSLTKLSPTPITPLNHQSVKQLLRVLQEALELHNPQFISRSQQRLKRLELMVQLRRAQHREAPPGTPRARARKLSTSTSSRKRQFTIPDPLSDNLFKPKERVIPEREMHMRSKRIYDNLPEVKKKQEEKQKRIIIQSNRLRVEMFKKVRISCDFWSKCSQ
uniref:Chromosome 10 open reading frame 90 n=1 Tax=Junco hyemalis TaxID=40217 RepID=A0A8C5NP67_JUNHY